MGTGGGNSDTGIDKFPVSRLDYHRFVFCIIKIVTGSGFAPSGEHSCVWGQKLDQEPIIGLCWFWVMARFGFRVNIEAFLARLIIPRFI